MHGGSQVAPVSSVCPCLQIRNGDDVIQVRGKAEAAEKQKSQRDSFIISPTGLDFQNLIEFFIYFGLSPDAQLVPRPASLSALQESGSEEWKVNPQDLPQQRQGKGRGLCGGGGGWRRGGVHTVTHSDTHTHTRTQSSRKFRH